jgi:hypothetical protein
MVPSNDPSWLPTVVEPMKGNVRIASGDSLKIVGKGHHPVLGPTFVVKGLTRPLHSISSDARLGLWTTFGPDGMRTTTESPIYRGKTVRTGIRSGNQFFLTPVDFKPRSRDVSGLAPASSQLRTQASRNLIPSHPIKRGDTASDRFGLFGQPIIG